MKKVTRLLLVAGVAAMGVGGFGACKEGPTVVQPPPPPPPPPEAAVVTIQGLRTVPGNDPVDPSDVSGGILVLVNVDPGDAEITNLSLLVDGNLLGCQTFAGASIGGVQASVSSSGQDVVECFLNTAATVGECEGAQLDARFTNGPHTIGARVSLSDGSTRDASNEQTVNFNNSNFLQVVHLSGGQGIVGNGRRFWGGEDIDFAACPVDFDGNVIGTVGIAGETAGSTANAAAPPDNDVDFGSGGGVRHDQTATPFVFTASVANNGGVEDDPALEPGGHTIGTMDFLVLADDGENVTLSYDIVPIEEFFLDFVGPVVTMPPGEILIDGQSVVVPSEHYSAGAFGLNGAVEDLGVGFSAGEGVQFDVLLNADDSVVAEDATGIDDVPEDDNDAYRAVVVSLADRLGNPGDETDIDESDDFGVDRTEPEISGEAPATAGIVLNNTGLDFSAEDPDLESGDPGSGVNNDGCAVACTDIEADANGTALVVTESAPGSGDFEIDISGLADGAFVVTVDVPDRAVLSPNVASTEFDFILDTTAPEVNVVNPPPANISSSAATLTFTFEGNASDENDLAALTLTITEPGVDGVCGTADDTPFPAGTGPGQVDPQSVDVDVSAGGTINFSQDFVFHNTSDGSNQTACFNATGEDTALDRNEDPNPNVNTQTVRTDIDWQTAP